MAFPPIRRVEPRLRDQINEVELNMTRTGSDPRWSAAPLPEQRRPTPLSSLPTPRRSSPASTTPLPDRITTPAAIADPRARLLYEMDAARDSYVLTRPGRVLARLRQRAAAEPGAQLPPVWTSGPRPRLSKAEWSLLLAVSTPGAERAHVLQAGALKHVIVQD